MSKPVWNHIGVRSYRKRDGKADAYVFGASCPACLWAWSVYYAGGQKAGVENSFRSAKKKADLELWAQVDSSD